MTPGFIPSGSEFLATIRANGVEEVIQENDVSLRFPSAAAAVLFATNLIKSRQPKPAPAEIEPGIRMLREFREREAEELRLARAKLDVMNVEVVTKKRRFAR